MGVSSMPYLTSRNAPAQSAAVCFDLKQLHDSAGNMAGACLVSLPGSFVYIDKRGGLHGRQASGDAGGFEVFWRCVHWLVSLLVALRVGGCLLGHGSLPINGRLLGHGSLDEGGCLQVNGSLSRNGFFGFRGSLPVDGCLPENGSLGFLGCLAVISSLSGSGCLSRIGSLCQGGCLDATGSLQLFGCLP